MAEAIASKQPLSISGGNSKAFYGREVEGEPLGLNIYSGIVSYEPTELVLTAKAGTPLIEVEQALADSGQMLAFEPSRCSDSSTIGGAMAAGLSGPRRPYAGAARDFMLGVKCINGLGQVMTFGGQVMKNVAGYDLSRLLTGSLGTLGIILELSLKVLPSPKHEITCKQAMTAKEAKQKLDAIAGKPYPVSGAAHDGEFLHLRLSGSEQVVEEAVRSLELPLEDDAAAWWQSLRDYSHPFFEKDLDIWRLSVPVTARPDFGNEESLLDWGGAQYWLASARPAPEIFQQATQLGGSATLFKTRKNEEQRFQPLSADLFKIHQGLKNAFDPHRIFNPGKMYAEL